MLTEPVGTAMRLVRTMVCLNDDTLFDVRDRCCPRCGSEHMVPIGRGLAPMEDQ